MTTLDLRPLVPEILPHAAAEAIAAGRPALAACRAAFTFECDPPLDGSLFPGPALRGLLGRALERAGSPAAIDFLAYRFRQEPLDAPGLWRFAFLTPPRTDSGVFEAIFTAYGPRALSDLHAATEAFALPGHVLEISGLRHRLALRHTDPPEAALLEATNAASADDDTRARETCAGAAVHCLTPLLINTGGKPLPARALALDPAPLLDSVRLRFAGLASLRRQDPRLVPSFPSALPPDRAQIGDVELHLPLQGRHQRLTGIVGSLSWNQLPAGPRSLLRAAAWLGAGRHTGHGAGTLVFEERPVWESAGRSLRRCLARMAESSFEERPVGESGES